MNDGIAPPMSPQVQASFDKILDCFSCADGGSELVHLKIMLQDLDTKQHIRNPEGASAFGVLRVVHQLAMLIELANGKEPTPPDSKIEMKDPE